MVYKRSAYNYDVHIFLVQTITILRHVYLARYITECCRNIIMSAYVAYLI